MCGLFHLLGYQFCPRLADIGELPFWRIDATADYGPLNGLARNRINTDLISRNWDDMLRVVGSLKLGTVSASTLIRALQGGGRPTTLARAIGEVGRIAKTLHLLSYADDELYRRRIQTQLNLRRRKACCLTRCISWTQRGTAPTLSGGPGRSTRSPGFSREHAALVEYPLYAGRA